ncbi:MAG: hypothetical protein WBE13_09625 [Candidatus Acidiferrum sp.]
MTFREELLIFWIFCLVVVAYAARHFFGGIAYLAEQMAAFSTAYVPRLVHLLIGHLH